MSEETRAVCLNLWSGELNFRFPARIKNNNPHVKKFPAKACCEAMRTIGHSGLYKQGEGAVNWTFLKLLILWCVLCGFSFHQMVWENISRGIRESRVRGAVVLGDVRSGVVLAATDRGIYRALAGGSFQSVLSFSAGDNRVYALYSDGSWVGAATNRGLWESEDKGVHWNHSFSPSEEAHRQCYAVFRSGEKIFLGTAGGVFWRDAGAAVWSRPVGAIATEPVYSVTGNDQDVFFAARDGIYRLENDDGTFAAEKIFAVVEGQEGSGDSPEEGAGADSYDGRFIRSLVFDRFSERIFAVTLRGFLVSSDQGGSWEEFSGGTVPGAGEKIVIGRSCLTSHRQGAPGIQNRDGRSEPEPILFLGTRSGAFVFSNQRWVQLYRGLAVNSMNDLVSGEGGDVLASTDSGLFLLKSVAHTEGRYELGLDLQRKEPSIQEVHAMVTFYADVGKDKIDRWMGQSRVRALLPSLSLQVKRDASALYHWDAGANPDVLQKGVETADWNVTLKWELSDLVWSSAQTSIDTRSKIMVELREDLLAQATRIYFERRRLQAEMQRLGDGDSKKWEMQIRIDELTAGLDAMTGGRFTQWMGEPGAFNTEKRR